MLQTYLQTSAFFPGLEVVFFGSPPHPSGLRPATLSKQERAFPLSRQPASFNAVLSETFRPSRAQIAQPLPSPAWRGCRPLIGGCGGDPFPFIPGSVECSTPISKPLRFFQAWRSTFSAPLHTRPGFAGPPSPSRRGLFLCPVGFILLHRSRRARLPGTRCGTADSRPGLKSGGSSSPCFSGTRLFFGHTAVLLPESAGYHPIR